MSQQKKNFKEKKTITTIKILHFPLVHKFLIFFSELWQIYHVSEKEKIFLLLSLLNLSPDKKISMPQSSIPGPSNLKTGHSSEWMVMIDIGLDGEPSSTKLGCLGSSLWLAYS